VPGTTFTFLIDLVIEQPFRGVVVRRRPALWVGLGFEPPAAVHVGEATGLRRRAVGRVRVQTNTGEPGTGVLYSLFLLPESLVPESLAPG